MSERHDHAHVREIARWFDLPGEITDIAREGRGHINRTFVLTIADGSARFVLQWINSGVFHDVHALMENIRRVTAHAADFTPTLFSARDGRNYVRNGDGGCWRIYRFVEGARSRDRIESPAQAREVARAFGAFQLRLSSLPGPRLHESIPAFHDTRRRFVALHESIAADTAERAGSVREEIAFALAREHEAGVLLDLHAAGVLPERVVHNDTKLNNLMLDEATGRATCVLDLDTVMPGLAPWDFGDMVRTASCAAAEDELDLVRVAAEPAMLRALAEGFIEGTGSLLNDAEIAHLAFAGRLITLEQGVRFLSDYLRGDTYYRVRHPTHNLERTRAQFALVRSLEEQHADFERTIQQLAARR